MNIMIWGSRSILWRGTTKTRLMPLISIPRIKATFLSLLISASALSAQPWPTVLPWMNPQETLWHYYDKPQNDTLRIELVSGLSAAYKIQFGYSRGGFYQEWVDTLELIAPRHTYTVIEPPAERWLYTWYLARAVRVLKTGGEGKITATYIAAPPVSPSPPASEYLPPVNLRVYPIIDPTQ